MVGILDSVFWISDLEISRASAWEFGVFRNRISVLSVERHRGSRPVFSDFDSQVLW